MNIIYKSSLALCPLQSAGSKYCSIQLTNLLFPWQSSSRADQQMYPVSECFTIVLTLTNGIIDLTSAIIRLITIRYRECQIKTLCTRKKNQ